MKIFVLGDSHVRIFKHMARETDLPIHIFPRSATTLFSVGRDGIDSVITSKSHKRCVELDSEEQPGHGDILVTSFGYVDVLNNLVRRKTREMKFEILFQSTLTKSMHLRSTENLERFWWTRSSCLKQPTEVTHFLGPYLNGTMPQTF